MSLEDIERKFYSSPAPEPEKKEPAPSPRPAEAAPETREYAPQGEVSEPVSPWAGNAAPSGGISRFIPAIVVTATVLLAVLAGFWGYARLFGGNATDALASVDVYTPLQAYRGVPFEARIDIVNGEEEPIEGNLSVSLSSGFLGEGKSPRIEEVVPLLAPGETYTKKFPVFAVGPVGSLEKLSAEFEYSGKKEYVVKGEKEVFIKEPGLRLTVSKREIPSENARFEISVNYENITGSTFASSSLEIRYPQGFEFVSATPPASSGNSVWNLGDVKPGAKGSFVVVGAVTTPGGAELKVPVLFSSEVEGERYPLIEESALLAAESRPVIVTLLGAGASDYVGSLGKTLTYTLRTKNNSGIDLSDVVVSVKLEGKMINFSRLESGGGTFNSVENTITWAGAQIRKLRVLAPSDTAEMIFKIPLFSTFPIQTVADRNFTVKGTVEITSPTVPQGSGAEKTYARVPFETKIAGNAEVEVRAWRKDPGGVVNAGSMPLRVNQPVQYTIHWKLSNYATNLRNVKIRAALMPGVKFTGLAKSNGATAPVVNDRTNIVEWTIPLVEAGSGVLTTPLDGVFQIEALPNVSQVGKPLDLLDRTTLTATDEFTGVAIQKTYERITALISHDPTFKKGDERVNE